MTFHVYCTKGIACGDVEAQRVPPGRVFVLGDFRDHSADSRVYGPIAEDQILGRASWYLISRDRSGVRWDHFGRPVK